MFRDSKRTQGWQEDTRMVGGLRDGRRTQGWQEDTGKKTKAAEVADASRFVVDAVKEHPPQSRQICGGAIESRFTRFIDNQ
jgi:hypothetical protein